MGKRLLYPALASIRILFLMLIFFTPTFVFSQANKPGSIRYLSACNGLNQGLVLGSDVRELPMGKLSFLDGDSRVDADSCLRYEYNDENVLAMPDSTRLDMIGLRTYKNKIVNIYVFFKITDAYKVLNRFISSYGMFTSRPDSYSDVYIWDTGNLNLSLRYQCKTDLGVAIFTNKQLEDEIKSSRIRQIAKADQDAQTLSLGTALAIQ